jgi:hypothetical protein
VVDFPNDDRFDEQLRRELCPRPAPPGLADRIVSSAHAAAPLRLVPTRAGRLWHQPLLRWAIAACLLVCSAAGGYFEHQREERIAGERARQQVLLALRITSNTLDAVHNKIVAEDRSGNQEESQ